MTEHLEHSERRKYERVWRESELYHRCSPGLRHAPDALGFFESFGCEHVLDCGAGDGRALRWFEVHGLPGWGVDWVESEGVYRHCLWHPIPEAWHADGVYCCDVMEHIPPNMVAPALEQIARATRVCGWFQIALFADTSGSKLDPPETLHLTVRPFLWWKHQLGRYFDVIVAVETAERPPRAQFHVTPKGGV